LSDYWIVPGPWSYDATTMGRFSRVIELPGCMTEGADEYEALRNLRKALALWLETEISRGRLSPILDHLAGTPASSPFAPRHSFIGSLRTRPNVWGFRSTSSPAKRSLSPWERADRSRARMGRPTPVLRYGPANRMNSAGHLILSPVPATQMRLVLPGPRFIGNNFWPTATLCRWAGCHLT